MEYLRTEEFLRKSGSLRGSVMIVGPLVARFGRALIPKPGGDKIGRRRLDTHFVGIQKLGACFSYDAERQVYEIEARQLKGAYMLLDEASVTGTANILMAAVLAEGVTTIYNAACEPYLQQLSTMLNRMGARISGVGSNLLTIEGVRSLSGTEHTILPDMIEVGSFIGMAAMTGSEITIKNTGYDKLGIIPDAFRRLGITVEQRGDDIYIPRHDSYEIDTFIDGSIMTIADADTVAPSNINRQLVALHSTVGRQKAEVLADRLRDINPAIGLTIVNRYIRDEETYTLLDAAAYDFVVDAIDTLSPKLALIKGALDRSLPLVSSMGAGAKTDPTKMEIADISKTHHCPLAHMLRKRLHKLGVRSGFKAVFSPEAMREGAMILCDEQNKKSNVGTISYIPALFGIGCASVAIRTLIGEMD